MSLTLMAIFSGLLVVGVNLILFVPGKTNNGVLMNLESHLCVIIEPYLGPRHSDSGVLFLRISLLSFLVV